jgi:hypothetical protein
MSHPSELQVNIPFMIVCSIFEFLSRRSYKFPFKPNLATASMGEFAAKL